MEEKILKDAQYRKGLSIAWFNATNSAITLISNSLVVKNGEFAKDEEIIKFLIAKYRDWFIEEHKNYYAKVIANVGQNFMAKDTIAKLEATKNVDELRSVWLALSADERLSAEIIKVKEQVKKKHEKTQ